MALLLCMAGCPNPPQPRRPTGHPAGVRRADGGLVLVLPAVPPELAIPFGPTLTLVAGGQGRPGLRVRGRPGAPPAWRLHAPRADLFEDSGALVGSHFGGADPGLPPGPYWEAKDQSRVHGANPVSVPTRGRSRCSGSRLPTRWAPACSRRWRSSSGSTPPAARPRRERVAPASRSRCCTPRSTTSTRNRSRHGDFHHPAPPSRSTRGATISGREPTLMAADDAAPVR